MQTRFLLVSETCKKLDDDLLVVDFLLYSILILGDHEFNGVCNGAAVK
jgi:hypothetical protein